MNNDHQPYLKEEVYTKQPVSDDSKMAAIKTLAIIGFLAGIVVAVWLGVLIVRFVPQAFSTLASLAESLSVREEAFEVKLDKRIVGSGESFALTWTEMRKTGTYQFSYRCTDGVEGETKNDVGDIITIPCDAWLTLPSEKHTALFVFTSDTKRFVDIPLTLTFTPAHGTHKVYEATELITIVNATIADASLPPVVATSTPPVTKPATTTPSVKPPVKPAMTQTVPVYTTNFPVSNPNGFTDLEMTYGGVGTYNTGSKNFDTKSSIDNDDRAALRFEVKNIGTKTSGDWTYTIELPGDEDYRSSSQSPLKPQERAVITILFEVGDAKAGTEKIEGEVNGGNDSRSGNNTFEKTIKITE